jgi:hypothetical protein
VADGGVEELWKEFPLDPAPPPQPSTQGIPTPSPQAVTAVEDGRKVIKGKDWKITFPPPGQPVQAVQPSGPQPEALLVFLPLACLLILLTIFLKVR